MKLGDLRLAIEPDGDRWDGTWSYKIQEVHYEDNGGLDWSECYMDLVGFRMEASGLDDIETAFVEGSNALKAALKAKSKNKW